MRIGLVRTLTSMADEDAVLHDDGAVAVLGERLAVRTFQIVRELLELVERLLGAGLARHSFLRRCTACFFFVVGAQRAVLRLFQTLQCTAQRRAIEAPNR